MLFAEKILKNTMSISNELRLRSVLIKC